MGSLTVFFAKEPSVVEVLNDRDGRVVNFFRVLRDEPERLARAILLTPWARDEFELSFVVAAEPLEDARRFAVRCWQSVGAMTRFRSGWKLDTRANSPASRVWDGLPKRLIRAAERIQLAQIENRIAAEVIAAHADRETLIYLDPPYPHETRDRKYYTHEMDAKDHEEMLLLALGHPGPVLLSSYASDLYAERLAGWDCRQVAARDTAAGEKQELLWINPVAVRGIQRRLPGMEQDR